MSRSGLLETDILGDICDCDNRFTYNIRHMYLNIIKLLTKPYSVNRLNIAIDITFVAVVC